jgi:soluble lytic murein transglycosylase-like protein
LKKRVVREFLGISIYNIEDYILKKLLLTFTLLCIMFVSASAQAADVNTVKATIVKHAIAMGVDPAIALSIARTESGFRHEARSSHGAVGVFQLMPSTARRMGLNPYSLNDNIKGGIMYYKKMYNMFGSVELALAAYNAGPGNVKKYNAIPPYAETRNFVRKITADVKRQKTTPDPIVAKVKSGAYTAKAPKSTPAEIKMAPAGQIVSAGDLQVEVVEENPIELKLETLTVSI